MKKITSVAAQRTARIPALLWFALLFYFIASFLHFAHNAEYLHDYPNLPEWLTRGGVYAAWCAVATIGVIGVLVYRFLAPRFGLGLMAVYAALGFGGFDHYVAAPMSAHTVMMNATILFEAATAGLLLLVVGRLFMSLRRAGRSGA